MWDTYQKQSWAGDQGYLAFFFSVLSNQQPTLIYVLLSVTIPRSQKVGTPRIGGPLVWWRPRTTNQIRALSRVVTVTV